MNIQTLVLGPLQVNCYIVYENQSCVVIDPGFEPERIMKTCGQLGLNIEAILLTHGHFDHVGGVQPLVQATGCALWMSQGDWSQVRNPMNDYLYPIANCDFTEVQFCEDGQVIRAADLAFSVLETPGHSWGSVCYRCGDAIFSGDTLFAGGCGRTDLPGGDWNTIRESLRRLADLPGNADVYPGHGESTTLDNERQENPYF